MIRGATKSRDYPRDYPRDSSFRASSDRVTLSGALSAPKVGAFIRFVIKVHS